MGSGGLESKARPPPRTMDQQHPRRPTKKKAVGLPGMKAGLRFQVRRLPSRMGELVVTKRGYLELLSGGIQGCGCLFLQSYYLGRGLVVTRKEVRWGLPLGGRGHSRTSGRCGGRRPSGTVAGPGARARGTPPCCPAAAGARGRHTRAIPAYWGGDAREHPKERKKNWGRAKNIEK